MSVGKDKSIKLSDDTEKVVLGQLREYMTAEFDVDIGNLPARFLLDFIIKTIEPHL